jgi:hypothetical protein
MMSVHSRYLTPAAEQQQRVQVVRSLDDAAQSFQLLHDLQYWLDTARDYHVPSHSMINSWIHGFFWKLR